MAHRRIVDRTGSPRAHHSSLRSLSGASVLISVSDDGRGIDAEAVRSRAIERGLINPDAQLSESEVQRCIFQPGFSTAKQVTDISGRGVGMDVVRRNIESCRGTIDVASRPGGAPLSRCGCRSRWPSSMACW